MEQIRDRHLAGHFWHGVISNHPMQGPHGTLAEATASTNGLINWDKEKMEKMLVKMKGADRQSGLCPNEESKYHADLLR